MDKISLLESEIKNYLQTIQKLSKPYEPKAVSRNANEVLLFDLKNLKFLIKSRTLQKVFLNDSQI
jgi:hypothetical protein